MQIQNLQNSGTLPVNVYSEFKLYYAVNTNRRRAGWEN